MNKIFRLQLCLLDKRIHFDSEANKRNSSVYNFNQVQMCFMMIYMEFGDNVYFYYATFLETN